MPVAVMASATVGDGDVAEAQRLVVRQRGVPLASVVSVTTPLKALPALARLIAPLVAVNDAMPATFRLVFAACVMLPALSMT